MPDSPCFSTRLDQQHASLKEPVALFAPLAQLLAAEDGQDLDAEPAAHGILCHYLQQQKELTYHRTCSNRRTCIQIEIMSMFTVILNSCYNLMSMHSNRDHAIKWSSYSLN